MCLVEKYTIQYNKIRSVLHCLSIYPTFDYANEKKINCRFVFNFSSANFSTSKFTKVLVIYCQKEKSEMLF